MSTANTLEVVDVTGVTFVYRVDYTHPVEDLIATAGFGKVDTDIGKLCTFRPGDFAMKELRTKLVQFTGAEFIRPLEAVRQIREVGYFLPNFREFLYFAKNFSYITSPVMCLGSSGTTDLWKFHAYTKKIRGLRILGTTYAKFPKPNSFLYLVVER